MLVFLYGDLILLLLQALEDVGTITYPTPLEDPIWQIFSWKYPQLMIEDLFHS
jgi:hypothetical protein